jgi:alpha-1,2-mannosyltransferase
MRGRSAAVEHAVFGLLPALICGYLLYEVVAGGLVAVDFQHAYWVAGSRVLHGTSPYVWTAAQVHAREVFVYPALAALMFAPFGLIPVGASEALFTGLCVAAALATLRALDVRDWRVYGVALVWPPVVAAWQTANLTLLLGLGLALLWRYRDRPAVAGITAAVLISLKPFAWPVALWLLATRRHRAAGIAVAAGLAINAVAWGVLGSAEIARYLHLSSQATRAQEGLGYGLIALVMHLGGGRGIGTAALVALSAAVAAATAVAGRRGHEREALTLTVALTLIGSPLVWNHYLALLIVPLAISRPRVGPLWLAGLLLWACPSDGVVLWQQLLAWGLAAGLVLTLARRPGPHNPRAKPLPRVAALQGLPT